MALQDIITNLGTAIINLVDRKVLKHCEQIETVLLELKTKIDILVEESGNSSGGDTPVTPPDEPVVSPYNNRVVYDETLGKDKIILDKNYLNTYIDEGGLGEHGVEFKEDLEIWINVNGTEVSVCSNQASYSTYWSGSPSDYTVSNPIYCYMSDSDYNGCITLYWNIGGNEIEVIPGEYSLDTYLPLSGIDALGLSLIKGVNTTDLDGTNLGSESFNIPI